MNEAIFSVPFIATAGWAETVVRSSTFVFVMFVAAVWAPISWVSHGSWFTVLGLVVIAIDITAAVAVGRRVYRFLHDCWRLPDWFIGFPLLLVALLPISVIHIAAVFFAARMLPSSLFGR